jgi:hypothetical protein
MLHFFHLSSGAETLTFYGLNTKGLSHPSVRIRKFARHTSIACAECLHLLTYKYYLTTQYRVATETLIISQLIKKYYAFLEPECSLLCSQKSDTRSKANLIESKTNTPFI